MGLVFYSILFIIIIAIVINVFNKLTTGRTHSATCLIGKTAIVTGGNSGIGYQVCLNLASRGCRVIIADKDNAEQAKNDIIHYSKNTNIIWKLLDLSSFQSIRDFAKEIIETEEKLDILINNAGIPSASNKHTEDGLNHQMQVNYFGPFLLTHLLTGILKKSAPSRIVFTSSIVSFLAYLTEDNLNFREGQPLNFFYDVWIYCNSKLATLIASDIFAKKLEGTGVTSNAIHPGLVRTPIFYKFYGRRFRFINDLYGFFNEVVSKKNSYDGAQTTVHVAVSNKLANVAGKLFFDCRTVIKPLPAYNSRFCQRIWDATEILVKLKPQEKL